ncbi:MAG: HlyD family efflux transporter periplasmic adaptor subunit [Desulfatiglans sp.]|jgi:HlyD family secretion protein|nr:HlyD family efflux transporter periplasmic adaptor subunit [Desulfatiglans sp.]
MKSNLNKNLFIISLFVITLLFSCSEKGKESYTLKPINLDYTVLASCTVSEPKPYRVKAKAGGDIIQLNVTEGTRVEKGETVALIDDYRERRNLTISKNRLASINLQIEDSKKNGLPRLHEQLKKDAATLSNSERYMNRLKKLSEAGGVSDAELDAAIEGYNQALSGYNQTKIEIDTFNTSGVLAKLETERHVLTEEIRLSEKAIDDKQIKAPYRGIITDVYFTEGETVLDNAELMSIIEEREWEIEANIDQRDMPFVKNNQDAFIVLDAYPSNKIAAKLFFVCLEVDISRGSCLTRLKITDKHDFIRYGMTGNVEIIAERFTNVPAAPSRFLTRADGAGYVYIKGKDGIAPVKTGFREVGEKWVILEDIPENTLLYIPAEK